MVLFRGNWKKNKSYSVIGAGEDYTIEAEINKALGYSNLTDLSLGSTISISKLSSQIEEKETLKNEDKGSKQSKTDIDKQLIKNQEELNKLDPSQVLKRDIARSSYFTVNFKNTFNSSTFKVPGNSFNGDTFLPVKQITMNYGSVESLSIPIACYADVPVTSKRKVGKVDIIFYDYDDDRIERGLRTWIEGMIVNGRTVYLSECVDQMTYKSYDVKGELNKGITTSTLLVVPVGEISISRSYESNAEKLVRATFAIVGKV